MKKLSEITEGILGDIAKRDLMGNEKREDENLETLYDYLTSHYNTSNLKTNFYLKENSKYLYIFKSDMMKDDDQGEYCIQINKNNKIYLKNNKNIFHKYFI